MRRDEEQLVRKVADMELIEKRKVGRPRKSRKMEIHADLDLIGVPEKCAQDRRVWKDIIYS